MKKKYFNTWRERTEFINAHDIEIIDYGIKFVDGIKMYYILYQRKNKQ